MQIKVNEIGRSMVEMLGVLAIIGILSITGVGTYQYALTAHQAGKVQDVLGKAKILAQTDSRTSHALEVNRFIKSALPEYSSDDKKSMVKLVNGKYQVTTFKVVHKVCEKLLQKESIFNEMGISVLTKICGNQNSKVNMVFEFNAIQTVETGTHFDGNNSSTVEPQSCPDKMVYRQKNDGAYGCICRHEYEFGDNCERCYPPKEWFDTENICRCPDYKPHWYNEDCVECVENTHCTLPMPVCNESHFCESCPSEKPYYNETTKVCESCSTNYPVYDVDDNQCITCYAANSAKPYWNGTTCTTCPTEMPTWSTTQNKCVTCYTANNAKPYWNGTTCTTCPTATPTWSTTQNKCVTCYTANSAKPHWNGTTCTTCPTATPTWSTTQNKCVTCYTANSSKPYWNGTTCTTCPTETPTWNTTQNKCVTCYAANSAKPHWNGTTCTTCPTATPTWSTTQNKCITCYAANSSKPYWNGTTCTTCPTATPTWSTTQNKCVTCYTANNAKPYWNGTTCTTCPIATPTWSTTQNKCVTCYTANNAKPYWNGTTCTTCPTATPTWSTTQNKCVTCYTANNAKPHWNGTTCTTCPTATPTWSTTQNKCVTCYTANSAKPYWNSSTKICEACPKTRPQYDASTNTCGCPDGAKVVNDVCTIVLRNDGGFNACPWGPAPGCIPVVTKFGPYNYNYKVYVDGYVDDNLRFYVNSTNMPSESHYNSWCDWITGTIVKSVGYNHYWQNELMGTLNAGDHGGLLAYSSSGCCYWKNPGKVWLELVP